MRHSYSDHVLYTSSVDRNKAKAELVLPPSSDYCPLATGAVRFGEADPLRLLLLLLLRLLLLFRLLCGCCFLGVPPFVSVCCSSVSDTSLELERMSPSICRSREGAQRERKGNACQTGTTIQTVIQSTQSAHARGPTTQRKPLLPGPTSTTT